MRISAKGWGNRAWHSHTLFKWDVIDDDFVPASFNAVDGGGVIVKSVQYRTLHLNGRYTVTLEFDSSEIAILSYLAALNEKERARALRRLRPRKRKDAKSAK
jgi:hypothetical protein